MEVSKYDNEQLSLNIITHFSASCRWQLHFLVEPPTLLRKKNRYQGKYLWYRLWFSPQLLMLLKIFEKNWKLCNHARIECQYTYIDVTISCYLAILLQLDKESYRKISWYRKLALYVLRLVTAQGVEEVRRAKKSLSNTEVADNTRNANEKNRSTMVISEVVRLNIITHAYVNMMKLRGSCVNAW